MGKMAGSKTVLATAVSTLLLSGLLSYKYVSWSHSSHYFASSYFGAQQPLEWIQAAQAECFKSRGSYCPTFGELLATGMEGEGRYKVEQQVSGRGADGTGSGYHYALENLDGAFEAKATCCLSLSGGADTWKTGPEGPSEPVVQSSSRDGLPYGSAAGLAALAAVLPIHVFLLGLQAHRFWKKGPGLKRRLGVMGFVVSGILLPFLLMLILVSG